jgi:hypothetical protein
MFVGRHSFMCSTCPTPVTIGTLSTLIHSVVFVWCVVGIWLAQFGCDYPQYYIVSCLYFCVSYALL